MSTRLPVLAAACLLAAAPARAQSRPPVAFVVEGALELGGDDLLKVGFTNGGSQTVKAGQGGTLAVGAEAMPFGTMPVRVRGTVGFKFVGTAADNANIFFTRFPVEALMSYVLPGGAHVGAGYTVHLAPRLHGDGFLPDRSFDTAHGPTAEVGWKWVALTYTALSYRDEAGVTFDGSVPGVSFTYRIAR